MDWSAGAAVGAGIVATIVMTIPMYMGLAMMPTQMPMNILKMLGTMMGSRGDVPDYMMGGMMHLAAGIVFALIHTGLFVAFDLEEGLVAWGILFGAVHWAISGMMMGMMRVMHPLVRSGELADPGPWVIKFPPMTIMGFLMVHIIYGLLVGALYEAWA